MQQQQACSPHSQLPALLARPTTHLSSWPLRPWPCRWISRWRRGTCKPPPSRQVLAYCVNAAAKPRPTLCSPTGRPFPLPCAWRAGEAHPAPLVAHCMVPQCQPYDASPAPTGRPEHAVRLPGPVHWAHPACFPCSTCAAFGHGGQRRRPFIAPRRLAHRGPLTSTLQGALHAECSLNGASVTEACEALLLELDAVCPPPAGPTTYSHDTPAREPSCCSSHGRQPAGRAGSGSRPSSSGGWSSSRLASSCTQAPTDTGCREHTPTGQQVGRDGKCVGASRDAASSPYCAQLMSCPAQRPPPLPVPLQRPCCGAQPLRATCSAAIPQCRPGAPAGAYAGGAGASGHAGAAHACRAEPAGTCPGAATPAAAAFHRFVSSAGAGRCLQARGPQRQPARGECPLGGNLP